MTRKRLGSRLVEVLREIVGPGAVIAAPDQCLVLVELGDADLCCGSAGVYNLLEADIVDDLLGRKLDRIAEAGADVVASGNPGCLLQLRKGLAARGLGIRAHHPVELLAWSVDGLPPAASRS